MDNTNDPGISNEQADGIIRSLEDIRDKLTRVNEQFGYISRFNAIKAEIKEIGWTGICGKYHPDINVGEPAAYELFQLYKFVYQNMDRSVS